MREGGGAPIRVGNLNNNQQNGKFILYFPKSWFYQYAEAGSEPAVAFNRRNEQEDVRTTVRLRLNLREWWKLLRSRLYNRTLGEDVTLVFNTEEFKHLVDAEKYNLDSWVFSEELGVPVDKMRNLLKLKKFIVIDRLLTTDLIFRLYLHIREENEEILELSKKYREVRRYIANMTNYQADKLGESLRFAKERLVVSGFTAPITLTIPYMLHGFVESTLPQASFNFVFTLALYNFFITGRYELFSLEPSEEFLNSCNSAYKGMLDAFQISMREIIKNIEEIQNGDFDRVLEDDLLDVLGDSELTFDELLSSMLLKGYPTEVVLNTVKRLHKAGILAVSESKGEFIKVRRVASCRV